jgi:hypothetical protein
MPRKIVGAILLLVACAAALFLLRAGRFVIPHVLGPTALAIIGILLFALRKKG